MTPDHLFDLIEQTIQTAADTEQEMHVYVERDLRGTFPTLSIRILPAPRQKKPKAGAKVISSRWVMPKEEVKIPEGAGS